jgi:hypothetical protein
MLDVGLLVMACKGVGHRWCPDGYGTRVRLKYEARGLRAGRAELGSNGSWRVHDEGPR